MIKFPDAPLIIWFMYAFCTSASRLEIRFWTRFYIYTMFSWSLLDDSYCGPCLSADNL